jgi:hypothetical protein
MANISSAVAMAVSIGVTSWVMQRLVADGRRTPARGADGSVSLRYGPMIAGIGAACVLLALAFVAIGVVSHPKPDERGIWLALIGTFGISGLWLLLVAMRYRLDVGPAGLRQEAFARAPVTLAWSDVRAVRFSSVSGYVTLEGATARVRASVMLRGIDGLWEAIAAQLPRAMWAEGRAQFDAYAQRMAGRAA